MAKLTTSMQDCNALENSPVGVTVQFYYCKREICSSTEDGSI